MTATNNTRTSRRFTWTTKVDATPYVCLINADTYTEAIAILEKILNAEYDLKIDDIEIETFN